MDIVAIGQAHLADALAGKMHRCDVTEWIDDETGKPIKVYWKPLTGKQQLIIDKASTEVAKVCAMVKERALDTDGKKIFKGVTLTGLANDFDYDVIRAIAFIIAGDIGQDSEEVQEQVEKE